MRQPIRSIGDDSRMTVGAGGFIAFNSEEESLIGGQGLEVALGAQMLFERGEVQFGAALNSSGLLNITSGKAKFNGAIRHESVAKADHG